MAQTENLSNKINASIWSEQQKQQIVALLPQLGSHVLLFLERRLSRSDFSLVPDELYASIVDGAQAVIGLNNGDEQSFLNFLQQAKDNRQYNFGEYLLPMVLDVGVDSRSVDQNLQQVLNEFELEFFQQLPKDELEKLAKSNILFFIRKLDLTHEFKTFYFLHAYGDADFGPQFRRLLEANQEFLGRSGLTRDSKNYSQTIGNWLKDYFVFSTKPVAERLAFEQVQYIERAPNVQRLNVYERKDLLEVIKLHAWFMHPEVSQAEIEGGYTVGTDENIVASIPPVAPLAPKSPNDWMVEAAKRRVEEQQKIDSKIEELKKKVK